MQELESKLYKFSVETNAKLKLGKRAKNKHKTAKNCWLCEEQNNMGNAIKVRGHCHSTSKF